MNYSKECEAKINAIKEAEQDALKQFQEDYPVGGFCVVKIEGGEIVLNGVIVGHDINYFSHKFEGSADVLVIIEGNDYANKFPYKQVEFTE